MTNSTSKAMCNKGIIAIRMAFKTTWRPRNKKICVLLSNKHLGSNKKIALIYNIFVIYHILLGTPDTRRKGRRTRKALSAFTSKPFILTRSRIVLTTLKWDKWLLDVIFILEYNQHTPELIYVKNLDAYPIMTMVKSNRFHVLRK